MNGHNLKMKILNIKKIKFVFVLLSTVSFIACQRTANYQSSHWFKEQGGSPPPAPQNAKTHSQKISFQGLNVEFSQQKFFGIEVANSYFKILSKNGEIDSQNFRWMTGSANLLKADALIMPQLKNHYLGLVYEKFPETKLETLVSSKMILDRFELEDGPYQILWKMTFAQTNGVLNNYLISRLGEIKKELTSVSCFYQSEAVLYPFGPLKSEIQTVKLNYLLSPESLVSPRVEMKTLSPMIATPNEQGFKFPQDDPRFYQVQAFHFVEQAYQWIKNRMQFELKKQIAIETSVGYPEKTNTAFYFDKLIRLGDGDDLAFSKIPLDPSIVTHEAMHALIDEVAHLPYQGEGGSLNEAFADFFTTTLLNSPNLGEVAYKKAPFKRTVLNSKKFDERTGGLYGDSAIFSGLLWQIRSEVGTNYSEDFAWKLLLASNPETNFSSMRQEVLRWVNQEPAADIRSKLEVILRDRGWLPQ